MGEKQKYVLHKKRNEDINSNALILEPVQENINEIKDSENIIIDNDELQRKKEERTQLRKTGKRFSYSIGAPVEQLSSNEEVLSESDYSLIENYSSELKKYFLTLNPEQYQAATSKKKYINVTAGAGCGKTKTLIARILYLFSHGISADRIIALTFSKKACEEIKERLSVFYKEKSKKVNVFTFHGWCNRLLLKYPELFRYKKGRVLDEDDEIDYMSISIFLTNKMKKKEEGWKTILDNPLILDVLTGNVVAEIYNYQREAKKSLRDAILWINESLVDYERYIDEYIRMYEIKKKARNYIDYTDMLVLVSEVVSNNEYVSRCIGSFYDYILVDEMQDIDPLQWSLISSLFNYCRFFGVGDEAQAIYGFRGGTNEYMENFTENVPKSHHFSLKTNYRSTQEILDISNWLLSVSEKKYDSHLYAIRGAGIVPELHTFTTQYEEDEWLINTILKKKQQGYSLKEQAILIRSATTSRDLEQILITKDIPYQLIGGDGLLHASHVADVLSVLRIILDNHDELAWQKYLRLWIYQNVALALVPQVCDSESFEQSLDILRKKHIYEAADTLFAISRTSGTIPELIDKIVSMLFKLLVRKYAKSKSPFSERVKDFKYVKRIASHYKTLNAFLQKFDSSSVKTNDKSKETDTLIISTIHSAKGREFPVCYLPDITPINYPSFYFTKGNKDQMEEERRVLYVAMTRAKNELIMSRSEIPISQDFDSDNEFYELYLLKGLPENLVKCYDHDEE